MRKRPVALLTAAALAAGTLAGCGSSASAPTEAAQKAEASGKESSQAAEGKTETAGQAGGTAGVDVSGATGEINVWTNLSQSEMNFYVEEFNKRVPGVKVTVTVMPGNEYRTKLQNAFRTGTNAPDVATFEISDFGMYKNTDLLENLSTESYDAEALSKDMIPYVDELSRDDSGNLRGLSYQATPGGFWYKKALAREYLGTDDPEELHEMLKDWDSIIEVGKQVYEKSGGKIGLLDDIETVEQIYCSYKGAPWVDENNHIISDDFLMEQLNLMQRVVDNNVDARADQWSAGWTSGMYSQDMFILIGLPSWALNFCIKPGIPEGEMEKAADTWGYMEAPAPYQNGGTWYGIYSGSKNKEAAYAWVKTMTADKDYLVNGLAGQLGDFPAYIPAIEQCIEEGHTDIVTGDQQYFQSFYDTAMNVKADPMTKYDRQAWTSMTAQMDLLAGGGATPEEACQGFKEDMQRIYPEIVID